MFYSNDNSRNEALLDYYNSASPSTYSFKRFSLDYSSSHSLSEFSYPFSSHGIFALGTTTSYGGQSFTGAPFILNLSESYSGCDPASPGMTQYSVVNALYTTGGTLLDTGYSNFPNDASLKLILTELTDLVGAQLDFYSAVVYPDASCQASYEFADQDFSDVYFYFNTGTQTVAFDVDQTVCGAAFTFNIDDVDLEDGDSNDMMALGWISHSASELTIDTSAGVTEGDWVLTGTAYDTTSIGASISIAFSLNLSVEDGNKSPVLDSEDCDGLTLDQGASEDCTFSFSDPNDEDTLTYSLQSPPTWASLSGTTLTIAPSTTETAGTFAVTARATDDN